MLKTPSSLLFECKYPKGLESYLDRLAPSKVQTFGSQLLIGRLSSRGIVVKRGVLSGSSDVDSVWCPSMVEKYDHLYRRYWFSSSIWYHIFRWVGTCVLFPGNSPSLVIISHLVGTSNIQKGLMLIWHTKIWNIQVMVLFFRENLMGPFGAHDRIDTYDKELDKNRIW